ncbi:MAG TPA: hypothetical protein VJI68_00755 [Candidatus Nanoarchaeia archaeon]|nr:hypothetical protein [Candidatus Nanoarchaeia archaeon]
MDNKEKQHLMNVLDQATDAINKQDLKLLKDLSNETIHSAAIYQEEHFITIAVLIYTLSKFYERDYHYAQFKGWKNVCVGCSNKLEEAKEKLSRNDFDGFNESLKSYLNILKNMDKKLKYYIEDVIRKAKINKASRLYEHGISLGRTAELLGISKFELMDYIGKTGIHDRKEVITLDPLKRIGFMRELFK